MWEKVRKILIGMLFGAMALQILFGVLWLCANIGTGQLFLVSEEYVANARALRFDEYSGVLYVLLVALGLGIETVLGLPYYIFVSLIQLAAAFVSGCLFFQCVRKGKPRLFDLRNVFGSLYLMTVPMLLQSHLAVRQESLMTSLFLAVLGLCVVMIRDKSFRVKGVCVLGAACVTVLVVNSVALQPAENKIQKTVEGAMVSRLVWPWFDQSYYFWPGEVKEVMSEELAYEISLAPENVVRVFGPLVEQSYGREKAGELYLNMAKSSLDVRTKEVMEGILTDFKAYLCVPLSLSGQLEGDGSYSYSGFNYKVMSEESPGLTKTYLQSSLLFMKLSLCGGFILALGNVIIRSRKKQKVTEGIAVPVIYALAISGLAAWFSLSGAGMMDYLSVSLSTAIWYLIPVWILKNLIKSDL